MSRNELFLLVALAMTVAVMSEGSALPPRSATIVLASLFQGDPVEVPLVENGVPISGTDHR